MASSKGVTLKPAKAISNGGLKSDSLPSRIKILNWGENEVIDGSKVILDDESMKVFYANQRSLGRLLAPLDFNHNTVPGTEAYKADKEPRAIAAYGVPTIVPGDGLYYDYLQWTPHGRESARDYADLSPTPITDEHNRVIGLHSCALTPAGAIVNLSFYSAPTLMDLSAGCPQTVKDPDADCDDDTKEDQKTQDAEAKAKLDAMSADSKPDHKSEYGDVEYADPGRHAYPIDTEQHVRAAWSYIHMPKNQKGYTESEVEAIKSRIASRAKHFKIELRAHSADAQAKVNAFDPAEQQYASLDKTMNENETYFRKELGLKEGATADDIMAAIRAKWEGLKKDEQPLPEAAPGSSVDPEKRNEQMTNDKTPHGTITYSAEELTKTVSGLVSEALKPLSAELTSLKAERDANTKSLEQTQRDQLVADAAREGKVIPLSAEEIKTVPVAILASMVRGLKPEVPMEGHRPLRSYSAGDAIKVAPGTRDRAASDMTSYFQRNGLERGVGYVKVTPSGKN